MESFDFYFSDCHFTLLDSRSGILVAIELRIKCRLNGV